MSLTVKKELYPQNLDLNSTLMQAKVQETQSESIFNSASQAVNVSQAALTNIQTQISSLEGNLVAAQNTLASMPQTIQKTKTNEETGEQETYEETNPNYAPAQQAVEVAKQAIENAKAQLEQAQIDNQNKEQALANADNALQQAQIAVAQAEYAVETAKNTVQETQATVEEPTLQVQSNEPSWMEENTSKFNNDDENGKGQELNAQEALSETGIKAERQEINKLNAIADGKTDGATYQYDTDGDGTMEEVSLTEWMEATQDCELDLYANEMMVEFFEYMKSTQVYIEGQGHGAIFKSDKAQQWLKEHHLSVTKLNSRNYVFNVIDDNGEIIKNKDGKTGEAMFFDGLIADGNAQKAEQNLAEILDRMGLDMLSKADFNGTEEEYDKLMQSILSDIINSKYESTGKNAEDLYGNANTLSTTYYYGTQEHLLSASEISDKLLDEFLADEKIRDKERKQPEQEKENINRIKKYALSKINEGYTITSVINTTKGKFGELSKKTVDLINDLFENHKKEKLTSEKEDKKAETELKNEKNEQTSKETNEDVLKEREREEELTKIA